MRFINVTPRLTDRPLLVSAAHIEVIEPEADGCSIQVGGHSVPIEQDADEIVALVEEALS